MKIARPRNLRTRLTLWYVGVLSILLVLYIVLVFTFQYASLTHQIFHDEVQDVETVEGLLFFDTQGKMHLQDNYHSHPPSHLLIDRLMEVRDLSDHVLYRSQTLNTMALGGPSSPNEGKGTFNQRVIKLADGSHVFLISHIHKMQGRTVLIRLGYSLVPLRQRMMQFFVLLLIALPIALLIAAVGGLEIAKRALRPLEQMSARAEQITANNLHDRLEIENEHDELGKLARVFNHLLQRLEESFMQLQRFTADAAHELRTPLAALRAVGEVALEEGKGKEEYREALGSILEESSKLNQTIESLLLLAKTEIVQPEHSQTFFLLPELVREVTALLGVLLDERNIRVVEEYADANPLQIVAERSLVRIALMNVLHNAVKFSPQDSTLLIRYTTIQTTSPMAQVSIQDQGPGIAAEDFQRVFDRFYTSSSQATARKIGTGLGLSIAKLSIDRNEGHIFFSDTFGAGALCVIQLPLAR